MEKFIRLPDKDSLTIREVAAALGIHISSAWRHILHGAHGHILPSFFVGSRRRVRRVDVEAWLAAINGDRHDATQGNRRDHRDRRDREAERVARELEKEGL